MVVRGVGSGQPCTEYEDSDTEVGVTRYALSGVCHRFVCRGIATPTRRATVLGAIPFQFVPNGMQNRMQQCLYVPACTGYVKTSLGPLGPRYAATRTRIFRLLNRSLSLSLPPSFSLRGSAMNASSKRLSGRLLSERRFVPLLNFKRRDR